MPVTSPPTIIGTKTTDFADLPEGIWLLNFKTEFFYIMIDE